MPRKQHTNAHTLTRIRQWDDTLEDWNELDDLTQDERIRKQPRDEPAQSGVKQERRKREKAVSRTINRFMRKYRQNNNDKP